MQERVQKIIAAAGITSRRQAEQLILEGRVRVNGQVVTEMGVKADPDHDHIKVDGKLINPKQPLTYIMLHKPLGHVTTMADPEGRPMVSDLLKGIRARVYPVGRLDYNTEGLLLLTNDGDFAHLVTHPSHELPKSYLVKVKGVLGDRDVEMLEKGVFLKDGKTAPARVRRLRKEEANSWVEITIHEGRKRQVRRMIDHTGHSVIKLKRTRIGNVDLGDLPVGTYRHLTAEEVKVLRDMAQGPGQPAHHVTGAPFRKAGSDWKRMEVEAIPGPIKRERKPAKERPAADAQGPRRKGTGRSGFLSRGERQRGGSARRPVQFRQRPEQRPGGGKPWQGEQRVEKASYRGSGPSSRTTGPGTGEGFRPRQSGGKLFGEGARRPAQREQRQEGRGAWQGDKGAGRLFEGSRRPFVKKGPRPTGGPRAGGGRTGDRRSGYGKPWAGSRARTEPRGAWQGEKRGSKTSFGGPGRSSAGRTAGSDKGTFSRESRGSSFGARAARPAGKRPWQAPGGNARPRTRDAGPRPGIGRPSGGKSGSGRPGGFRPPKGRGPRRG
jgi:23S rRNA pseudouridine2605 synthase